MFVVGGHIGRFREKGNIFQKISPAKAQRRKEALKNAAALCVFAPLREKKFILPGRSTQPFLQPPDNFIDAEKALGGHEDGRRRR
jgi:hypothetical protein